MPCFRLLEDLLKLFMKPVEAFRIFTRNPRLLLWSTNRKGENQADTWNILCLWALIMILENNELNTENFNVIKP